MSPQQPARTDALPGPPGQLGQLIRHHRTARGLTQRDLATAAKVSLGTLRDLEQGRTVWSRWLLVERLALALDLDLTRLAQPAHAGPAEPTVAGTVSVTGGPSLTPARQRACVRIAVLGPVTARLGDLAINLGSVRQRAVLVLLALKHGVGMHRDAVIDVLWGSSPPPSAAGQVHGHMSRLRKLLGAADDPWARGALIARAGARYYLLQADADQLDVAAFQQLAGQARHAAAHGGQDRACDLYDRALAQWHGDVASDVHLLREHPAVTELTHQRGDAILGYAEAALRAAVPQRVLAHLRQLCDREPFNEAAHARLMTVLAAAGQRASALETFARLRHRLGAELGVGPGPEAVSARARILRRR